VRFPLGHRDKFQLEVEFGLRFRWSTPNGVSPPCTGVRHLDLRPIPEVWRAHVVDNVLHAYKLITSGEGCQVCAPLRARNLEKELGTLLQTLPVQSRNYKRFA
jgi:hypothetical protein